jgi:hypothetical protein
MLQAAWHPTQDALRAALINTLAGADLSHLAEWDSPEAFIGAVGESVDSAMYWQPPDDEDTLAAAPDLIEALRPIAKALTSAPGTVWWTDPVESHRQLVPTYYAPGEPPVPPDLAGAAARLSDWRTRTLEDDQRARRERPADPAANYGGYWWSAPSDAGLPRTTRALPSGIAVHMIWEEATVDSERAAVWTTRARAGVRIYELTGPGAWVDLVRRYPLDVTFARRHEWYKTTHCDGQWLIPDWEAVSHDYDAVHLTVLGYLTAATRALTVNDAAATMLAGWNPDETIWLTDTLELTRPQPEHWTKVDGFGTSDAAWQRSSATSSSA